MTKDEIDKEVGRAFEERRRLTEKLECLRYRLRTYGGAYVTLADSPFEQDLRETADRSPDLREDWEKLKKSLQRIDELNRLLGLS